MDNAQNCNSCMIWGVHGGGYEEFCVMGRNTKYCDRTFHIQFKF
jgi:hypothetical protein